jgi:hypothetical protein
MNANAIKTYNTALGKLQIASSTPLRTKDEVQLHVVKQILQKFPFRDAAHQEAQLKWLRQSFREAEKGSAAKVAECLENMKA